MGIKISGIGIKLPKKLVYNNDLAEFLDTNDDWIVSRTGIKSRHIVNDESLTYLAVESSKKAIADAGIALSDIDMIICATMSGDYITPSLSCCVAERLSISCKAVDVNAACTGFIYALDIAASYLAAKRAENILVITADCMSKHIDWTDRNVCVLFGDGTAACVVTNGNALKYSGIATIGNTTALKIKTGTGNSPFVKEPGNYGYLHMDGQEVFKFAVRKVAEEAGLALENLGMTADEIDCFVLHQANIRIIDGIKNRLKQPDCKFPVNINSYGNMSAASIPVLLRGMLDDGRLKKGNRLLMSAFGAGLTIGTMILEWD